MRDDHYSPPGVTASPDLILVLGPHRSGTSAITKVLALLGGSLPEPLLRPDLSNPTGFWEPVEAIELNDTILAGLGSAWNDPAPLPPAWLDLPAAVAGVSKAADLARRWMALPNPTIVKDPRLCRLLPLWRRALAGAGADVTAALVLRRPEAATASLTAREDFAPNLSLWLWLQHTIAAEIATRDLPRTVVDYDALMEDPDSVVAVGVQLGLPAAATATRAVREFLQSELRHHDGTAMFEAAPVLAELAGDLHATLARHASGSAVGPDVASTVSAIAARMAELEGVVPEILRGGRNHERASREALDQRWQAESDANVHNAQAAFEAYEARLADAAEEIAYVNLTLDAVRLELAQTSDLLIRTQQARVLRYARAVRRMLGRDHVELWPPPSQTTPVHVARVRTLESEEDPSSTDVAFVLVAERGSLEWQSVLLVDSLRQWGGALGTAPVYVVSPRHDRRPRARVVAELERLGVCYIDSVENPDTSGYGSVNRIIAAAHIERTTAHDVVVVLDSDTLVLGPLDALELGADVDVAARPADHIGISTTGSNDAMAPYWEGLCQLAGAPLSMLPRTTTSVDTRAILANYNGGLVAARRSVGVLAATEKLYFDAATAGIRPHRELRGFRAGAGPVSDSVAQIFGSAQAVFSVAAWSLTRRVDELPATYNLPLHLFDELPPSIRNDAFPRRACPLPLASRSRRAARSAARSSGQSPHRRPARVVGRATRVA